jgi:SAM-dependent methyltransferase
MTPDTLSPDFWQQHYEDGTTRWDLGQPSPPLVSWWHGSSWQPQRAIVLGCGRGHDARFLAAQGVEVLGIDFAPGAIAAARQQHQTPGLKLEFVQQDMFQLLPDYAQQFDLVVEHTCYCAIDPSCRDDYVALAAQLLRPQGRLVAVFFTHNRGGGPPYATTPAEIRQRFSPRFQLLQLTPVENSVPSRAGEEHLGAFEVLARG